MLLIIVILVLQKKNTNNNHYTHTPESINNGSSTQNQADTKEESKKNKNKNKDDYKLCIIKEKDLLTDKRYKYNYDRPKKTKKEYVFHKLDKGIHFNNIPVVDYDENTNNSFVWQRIPENDNYYKETYEEMDYISYQRDRENIMNNDHNNIDEMENVGGNIDENINNENNIEGLAEPPALPKFSWVNLSESAYKQSGFILKAVIKGDFITENFKDNNVKIINMFGHGYINSNDILYNPKYRLFNFNCTFIPEFIVDHKLLKSIDFHNTTTKEEVPSEIKQENTMNIKTESQTIKISENNIENITEIETENYKYPVTENSVIEAKELELNCNDDDYCLNDEKTKDFTIIIPEWNQMDNDCKYLKEIREKCNIKKESSNINCIIDNDNNDIKYYIHMEMLYQQSDYFYKICNMEDPYIYKEHQHKEIILKNVDYISFYQILFYCYNGYFPDQASYNMYDWIALLIVSSRFLFQSIFNYCEYQLKQYINKETIDEINEIAIVNNALQVKRYCYLYKMYYGLEIDDDEDEEDNDVIEENINTIINNAPLKENKTSELTLLNDEHHDSVILPISEDPLNEKNENAILSKNETIIKKLACWFKRCFLLKQLTFQFINLNLTLISCLSLFLYMNAVVFICLPFSIIKSYIWFIYFFIISVKGMIFVMSPIEGNTWYQKIYSTLYFIFVGLLMILCYIICAVFLFTVGNILNILVIGTSIVLCLTCQSILWPIIDSVKSFKIINSIIKGYCNGMKNEYKHIDKNEKYPPYTCITESDNQNNNKVKNIEIQDHDHEGSFTIIKSAKYLDDEISNPTMNSKDKDTKIISLDDPLSINQTSLENSQTKNEELPSTSDVNNNTMIPNTHNDNNNNSNNNNDIIIDIDFNNITSNNPSTSNSTTTINTSSSGDKIINRIKSAGNEIEIKNGDSSSSSSSSSSFSSMDTFKNHNNNSLFTLSLKDSTKNKMVSIPLNYFENKSFINNIYHIWKYRLKSSIILCGRWWRIICSHPFGLYFIVFPGITKQIYLNGYEGHRFFWWHKKTVIEKPYLL